MLTICWDESEAQSRNGPYKGSNHSAVTPQCRPRFVAFGHETRDTDIAPKRQETRCQKSSMFISEPFLHLTRPSKGARPYLCSANFNTHKVKLVFSLYVIKMSFGRSCLSGDPAAWALGCCSICDSFYRMAKRPVG